MNYGYSRVSTRDQNEERQRLAMGELEIPEKNLYRDHQSGKDFDRPQYRKLVRRLKRDDVLYTRSIDRLGRNYREILEQWRVLIQGKGGGYRGAGHAPAGHEKGQGPDGDLSQRHCPPGPLLRGGKRAAAIHQRQAEGIAAARPGASASAAAPAPAGEFSRRAPGLAQQKTDPQAGRESL